MNKHLLATGAAGVGIALFIGLWGFSQALQGTQGGGVASIADVTAYPATSQPVSTVPRTTAPDPDVPFAYFADGTRTDVRTLLRTITTQHAALDDAAFFAWLHKYWNRGYIEGTVWVRTSDAPLGSASWLQGDARPQVLLVGCGAGLPLGYHSVVLTSSNVVCLNGECVLLGRRMPVTVDGGRLC
jgi:hypothetical protein